MPMRLVPAPDMPADRYARTDLPAITRFVDTHRSIRDIATAEPGPAQGVGHRATRGTGFAGRRAGVTAFGGAAFSAGRARRLAAGLVIEPERQADAFARLVHVQHFHAHDIARLHD